MFQGKPKRIDHALQLALEFEAFKLRRSKKTDHTAQAGCSVEVVALDSPMGLDSTSECYAWEEGPTNCEGLHSRIADLENRFMKNRPRYVKTHNRQWGQTRCKGPQPRSRSLCFYCSRPGHRVRECRQRKRDRLGSRLQP